MSPLKTIRLESVAEILRAASQESDYSSIRKAVGKTPNRLGEYIDLLKRVGLLDVNNGKIKTTRYGSNYIRKYKVLEK